jgi:dephospho-CoA kinase
LKIIGVTGGIGSGKSTVSRILRDLGAKIISADKIARDIVYKGEKALLEIVEHFGDVYLPVGY